ncbi:MAG TPA: hypothetical protein PKW95_20535 [bacterium]|nr:hypothetical protein [bacterium]
MGLFAWFFGDQLSDWRKWVNDRPLKNYLATFASYCVEKERIEKNFRTIFSDQYNNHPLAGGVWRALVELAQSYERNITDLMDYANNFNLVLKPSGINPLNSAQISSLLVEYGLHIADSLVLSDQETMDDLRNYVAGLSTAKIQQKYRFYPKRADVESYPETEKDSINYRLISIFSSWDLNKFTEISDNNLRKSDYYYYIQNIRRIVNEYASLLAGILSSDHMVSVFRDQQSYPLIFPRYEPTFQMRFTFEQAKKHFLDLREVDRSRAVKKTILDLELLLLSHDEQFFKRKELFSFLRLSGFFMPFVQIDPRLKVGLTAITFVNDLDQWITKKLITKNFVKKLHHANELTVNDLIEKSSFTAKAKDVNLPSIFNIDSPDYTHSLITATIKKKPYVDYLEDLREEDLNIWDSNSRWVSQNEQTKKPFLKLDIPEGYMPVFAANTNSADLGMTETEPEEPPAEQPYDSHFGSLITSLQQLDQEPTESTPDILSPINLALNDFTSEPMISNYNEVETTDTTAALAATADSLPLPSDENTVITSEQYDYVWNLACTIFERRINSYFSSHNCAIV